MGDNKRPDAARSAPSDSGSSFNQLSLPVMTRKLYLVSAAAKTAKGRRAH
jgi:hypothetical protein